MFDPRRVFVITPTYKTPEAWLKRCIESVKAQTIGKVMHIIINDGDPDFRHPDYFPGDVLQQPRHNNYGDTPRWVGVECATQRDATVIAFLDADNWYEPDHLETALATAIDQMASVVATKRSLFTLDEQKIAECPDCGTQRFTDTSAMVFTHLSFSVLQHWRNMQSWQHAIADRIIWHKAIQSTPAVAYTRRATLNYRCTHKIFYDRYGLPVPDGVKTSMQVENSLAIWEQTYGKENSLAF
jgi:glycosyltransferase involved in cell wall biosynthesis